MMFDTTVKKKAKTKVRKNKKEKYIVTNSLVNAPTVVESLDLITTKTL